MTFKEARKQARILAAKKDHWTYIYKDNSKKNNYYISEDYDFTADFKTSFYVHKSGKIINIANYKAIAKNLKKNNINVYPFSPIVMEFLEKCRKVD